MAVYPNIYPEHIGRVMPDVLGFCSLTTGECDNAVRGAVEAVYVDTSGAPFSYLAARGTLHGISQVFSDGVLIAPANYAIVQRDGGRTYIDFVADQGDRKIAFNATGYMFGPWNSGAGYIQNPAYIILFYLAFIIGVPNADIDVASFDTLAALYDALGAGTSGKLIIQDTQESEAVLQELLFSYGAKLWTANDGRLKIEMKSIAAFATNIVIFSQIDVFEVAERRYNLATAVNSIKSQYDFIPTASFYKGALEDDLGSSIADYEAEMESQTPYHLPWTDSAVLVTKRLTDDLLKMGHGDRVIAFPVPIKWIDTLDIYTNFRFQDPYALSWTKAGDKGYRIYYIISLEADYQNQIINIEAVDLQWLLRQYMIIADCDDLSSQEWDSASEEDRMYAYICDCTGESGADEYEFPDGEPCKIIIDCDDI